MADKLHQSDKSPLIHVILMSIIISLYSWEEANLQFCVDHIAEGAKYQANHLQKEPQHVMNSIIAFIYTPVSPTPYIAL